MAGRRTKRFSRRTGAERKRSRVPAYILCIVIFLVLSFAISVVIGLLLRQSADRITSRPKYDFQKVEYQKGNKTLKSIEGYFFAKGSSAADYYMQGIEDFSMSLRHTGGALDYSSTVAATLGLDTSDESSSLYNVVRDIHDVGGRACGYFYVKAFEQSDKSLRDVYAAYELSLIGEAAESGIDEILLLGITVTDENTREVEDFLARASRSAQSCAIGVAVSADTLKLTEDEIYYVARLKESCDFVALDLTHLTLNDTEPQTDGEGNQLPSTFETVLEQNEYYIRTYGLRLLFSKQEYLIYRTAIELGVVDFQIVDK